MGEYVEDKPFLAGDTNQGWMDEIMFWDGQGDSTPQVAMIQPSYPISPSSTACEDPKSSTTAGPVQDRSQDLPTPTQSPSSPDVLLLTDPRLSGEPLRNPVPAERASQAMKRKISDENVPLLSVENVEEPTKPASKKRPHNVIEKRYRANLNDRIAELRDSVPNLRRSKKPVQEAMTSDVEDGLASANRLNKASILSKAVEYIRHLELRNKKLDHENVSLKERLRTLERVLASAGDTSAQRATAFTTEATMEKPVLSETSFDDNALGGSRGDESEHAPQGLIPVPESMRRLRADQPQEHYGAIYDNQERRNNRKWPARLMLGSLAGLMVMEGFSESNRGSDSKEKGLFGIPLELLDGYLFLRSPRDFITTFLQYCHTGGILSLIKGFLALTILAFVVFAYLFNSKPSPPVKTMEPSKPQRAPSLASPIEVRRQAWLTSMQTLKLPHHSFIPEWLAVNAEWLKYTIRLVLGWSTYSWLTGRSGDDELARIKAWDIAIDAQLAGGDPEVSRSRVVLTIFASGLLPKTPSRSMLKALHCRTVLWRIGNEGGLVSRLANKVAIFLANYQWRAAQQLHHSLPPGHPDALPTHLAYLLGKDCDQVMLDAVVQRAYNLMYDRPTNENTEEGRCLMDVIVEDHAIRSPLDALAAWWSSQALRRALTLSLAHQPSSNSFPDSLRSALSAAPCPSAAYARALAVQAAFFKDRRAENIQNVLLSLPRPRCDQIDPPKATQVPNFIDSSTPRAACDEILLVLKCAMIMDVLDDDPDSDRGSDIKDRAAQLFSTMPIDPTNMTLLSFTAAYCALQQIQQIVGSLQNLSGFAQNSTSLSLWAHITHPDSACLTPTVLAILEGLCTEQDFDSSKRRHSSVSNDTGYASLDDGEVD